MTDEGINYLISIVNNMTDSKANDKSYFRLIRQNNVLNMCSDDVDKIQFTKEVSKYYHCFSGSKMIKAYEPFLNIIREIILRDNIDIDWLLKVAGVYSLQKTTFKNYFLNERCIREDEPILSEIKFERKRFVKGISNILKVLAQTRPVFILLDNFNLVCDSTLEVVEYFINQKESSVYILAVNNEVGNINSYMTEKYSEFIDTIEKKELFMDWPDELTDETYSVLPTSEQNFIFDNSSTQEYIKCITNMMYTFAFEQACFYLNMIYQKIDLEKVKSSEHFRFEIQVLYINTCIYMENFSMALLLCEEIKQISLPELQYNKEYLYAYLKATANMYIGNEVDAKKMALICEELSVENNNEFDIFRARLLSNMAELSGWKEIWICEKLIEVPDELTKGCIKYGFINHLSHIYVYCYDNEDYYYKNVATVEKKTAHVTEGIKIAKRLGNDHFLIEAYRKHVMMASISGYFEVSNYFYRKSIRIAKKNKNKIEEASIYNGLGYNYSSAEMYVNAQKNYNRALKIYCEERNCDYIAETLYNMGMNAILAGDYKEATNYLMTINSILKKLKKNSLRVCNISKIFGLIALAAQRQGNIYLSKVYLDKAKHFLDYILNYDEKDFYRYIWDDDLFLYYNVKALLLTNDGKYKEALYNYDRAELYMKRSVGSFFFNYSQYVGDKYLLLKKLGKNDEASKVIKAGISYFNDKGNSIRADYLEQLENGNTVNLSLYMPLKGITIDKIMELVRVESIEEDAKSRKNDIKFFANFQEFINQNFHSIEEQIQILIINFKNNFNLDNILFISCENNKNEIKYSDLEYSLCDNQVDTIVNYFVNNPVGFALSKLSNNYYEYEKLLSIFYKSKLFSMMGVPIFKDEKLTSIFIIIVKIKESWNSQVDREALDAEDLDIYQTIFRQITGAIDKYKLDEMLKRQAITDELTGLLNRKGYYQKVYDMINEYNLTGKFINVTLLYADLDHFKYYNDTFGHHVGDELLVKFARIFKTACKDKGTVVRFGGDEFVMLLDTTDKDEINKVVKNIFKLIKKENGFQDVVKRYNDGDIYIPQKYMATCSIGVAVAKNAKTGEEISELRKHADSKLYDVKNNGRGFAAYYGD